MRLPKLPARRDASDFEEQEIDQHPDPVATGEIAGEPAGRVGGGYSAFTMPSLPSPSLSSDMVRSIRFTVSQPQGYYFQQVETFVEQSAETIALLEGNEFTLKQFIHELLIELDQQSYDSQRLRSEIEIFKVQGSPLVNADGSYVTESQREANEMLVGELAQANALLVQAQEEAAQREAEIAHLRTVIATQDHEVVSMRQWNEAAAAELAQAHETIAALQTSASPDHAVEPIVEPGPIDEATDESGPVDEPVDEPVEQSPSPAAPLPQPEAEGTDADDSPGVDTLASVEPDDIPDRRGAPEAGHPEIAAPDTDQPEDEVGPPVPSDVNSDAAASADDAEVVEISADPEPDSVDDAANASHDAASEDDAAEENEAEDEDATPVSVVPVDSELPEGAELPGTGENAITYPPAAPGLPIDTQGIPVEVWAPELDPRLRAMAEETEGDDETSDGQVDEYPEQDDDAPHVP